MYGSQWVRAQPRRVRVNYSAVRLFVPFVHGFSLRLAGGIIQSRGG